VLVDVQAQPHIRVLPRHHVLPGVRVRSIKPVKDWCGTACGSLFLEFTTKGSVQYVLEFGNKNGNATWKTLQFPFLRRSCQARRLAMKETHEFRVLVELNGPPATRAWVMNKTLVNAAQVCRDRNAVRNPVLQPLIIKVVPSKAVRPCRWDFGSPCRCQSHHPQPVSLISFPYSLGRCALSSHSKIARQRQTSATGWVHARHLNLISALRFPNFQNTFSKIHVVSCVDGRHEGTRQGR
jgi:hypothetical protein